jgi:hypothetical protein
MRCPEAIVRAVGDIVERARAHELLGGRIAKPYEPYPPRKGPGSARYPRIRIVQTSVQSLKANYFGRYIAEQIDAIPAEEIAEGHESASFHGPAGEADHSAAAGREQGRDLHIAMNVIRPAMQKQHGRPITRTDLVVADIEHGGLNLLDRSELGCPVFARIPEDFEAPSLGSRTWPGGAALGTRDADPGQSPG